MEKLYEYKSDFYSDGRSEKLICQGRKSFIDDFISQEGFHNLFGGLILSENIETGEEVIGVWGSRKCQRLRRILRERGAEFILLKETPAFRRIYTSTGSLK
ncbi:MAG: hypothetical protein WA584_15470 [Pyrinomonadaceae bacterium]